MSDWNTQVIEEFRANGGTVTNFGRRLVLLHHRGAKSGVERVSPVMGLHTGPDTWLICASKGGRPENPAWYHNLLAHPEVSIETPDDGVVEVQARDLAGVERDEAWDTLTTVAPGFLDYQQKTTRTIPMLELRRR